MGFSRPKGKNILCYEVGIVIFIVFATIFIVFKPWEIHKNNIEEIFSTRTIDNSPEIRISSIQSSESRNQNCDQFRCFDIYKCSYSQNKLSVYIYPIYKYIDDKNVPITLPHSREFVEILQTIRSSKYYVSSPKQACIFIPSIDLLNQKNLRLKEISQVLSSLPHWSSGRNHLLFNMLPGNLPDYNPLLEIDSGQAMIAGAGHSTWTYRETHDISIPVFSSSNSGHYFDVKTCQKSSREWLAISAQINIHYEYQHALVDLAEEHPELLVLGPCSEKAGFNVSSLRCRGADVYEYPFIFEDSTFCLLIRAAHLGQPILSDALRAGCIPVIIADSYILDFSEIIDWKRASIIVYEEQISDIIHILKSISDDKISEMRKEACILWQQYFSSIKQITHTVLEVLNSRIFPQSDSIDDNFNNLITKIGASAPLFLPTIVPKSQGFTAVILTYDRIESLFQVIKNVVQAPSLTKVLVVWNNQQKSPPSPSAWPKINKPLKVVQTKKNILSNRFYPYDEIQTEAILAIDDDIVMLTADELEFGYEVWREFNDRIVGFPSRVHVWDNVTKKFKYVSEWTNEISMVLTGAAFYNKYYSYLYTNSMPGDIKEWVDEHMNCEDIAMNFLVANVTGKSPIKVTPRKKFKCPECTNVEMLSADVIHMAERSECINRFYKIYGIMTLKTVEYRADPVLYKDNFPEKLKRFNNVGSL